MVARNILILLALVLAAQMSPVKSSQRFEHPGTIVGASDGRGIKADATAYSSRKRVSNEACPVYEGDPLDSQRSRAGDGSFAFRIDSSKTSYVAVYCQGGYQQFTNEINDNSHDRKRIEPDPHRRSQLENWIPTSLHSQRLFDNSTAQLQGCSISRKRTSEHFTKL